MRIVAEKARTSSFCRGVARLYARLPDRHSLTTKILVVSIVFALVPVLVHQRLGEADTEKWGLFLKGSRERGMLIATYLTPHLKRGLGNLEEINDALETLSSDNLNIRILFRPNEPDSESGFYYVASNPPLSKEFLDAEIDTLARLGVLTRLSNSCSHHETVRTGRSADGQTEKLITIISPVATASGCWSIVTSYGSRDFLGASLGRHYWQAPEFQFATILYFSAAAFTILVLLRIRSGLRVFRKTAVATGRYGGAESFASKNRNPDLDDVAHEFDRMVQRIGLLSFAVENSPIAVAITNGDWALEYVNPAYEALSGKGRDALLGADLRKKEFQSLSDESWAEVCTKVALGGRWHGQIRRYKPDGRLLWADVALYRLIGPGSAAEHFVCLQEDVSEQKRILDNLIQEKDRAESLNQLKSSFVACMSHEFRTPLNAILGFSEMIAEQTFGKCTVPKYVEYAGHIRASGMHLLSLINDILDLSKLESGKESLNLEPMDLAPVISEATTFVANDANKAQVILKVDNRLDGQLVVADRRAMRQVLLNLLSNSIKFTPAGGEITVAAEPRRDGRVLLRVADTGCGIAEAELPKVCEPYERAGTAYVRSTTGTGLGLPIVKKLVEIQNGEFEITSKVGAGTTVQAVLASAPRAA